MKSLNSNRAMNGGGNNNLLPYSNLVNTNTNQNVNNNKLGDVLTSRSNELRLWISQETEIQSSRVSLQEEIQHQVELRSKATKKLQDLKLNKPDDLIEIKTIEVSYSSYLDFLDL